MKHFLMAALLLTTAATHAVEPAPDRWLEDTAAPDTQAWIKARNAESERRLQGDPRYAAETRRFLAQGGNSHSEDYLDGGLVHRLRSDAKAPLGRWQVKAASPSARVLLGDGGWHTVLDLDALARKEGVRWKFPLWWKNPSCDTTISPRCIVNLSPDGGDRTVVREIDLRTGRFIDPKDGGFRIDTPSRSY